MCKRRTLLRVVAITFVIFLATVTSAQTTQQVGKQEVFASVHERLTDAADRVLASALSEKPWMQAAIGPPDSRAANTADPVVRLRAGVERVRQLQPTIEPILREEGVPTELSAIVLVESGGIPTALSPRGARGVWQLMPERHGGTAQLFPLAGMTARTSQSPVAPPRVTSATCTTNSETGGWRLLRTTPASTV